MRVDFKKLLVSVLGCQLVGAVGAIVTMPAITNGWYNALNKPPFTPPSAIFGPVWTILYLMMGLSLYLLWVRGAAKGKAAKLSPKLQAVLRSAIVLSVLQLAFNFSWSLFFFGFQLPAVALVIVAMLWLMIALLIARAWRISSSAALLLFPYLAWITFAGVLNLYIVMLN